MKFFSRNLYHRNHFFHMIAMMILPLMGFLTLGFAEGAGGKGGVGTGMTEGETKLLEKVKEVSAENLKKELGEITVSFEEKIKEAGEGKLTVKDFEAYKNEVKETLDKYPTEEFDKVKNAVDKMNLQHADVINKLAAQGLEITKLRTTTGDLTDTEKVAFHKLSRKKQFEILMRKGMETDEFKKWEAGDMKNNTSIMDAKAVIGLAADHTGSIFVTEPEDIIRDIPREQPHMRDYISVGTTDETKITYPEITDYTDIYTLGAQMLTENEEITDVSFKSKENTSEVVRMGVSMSVSKRYFRGRSNVMIEHIIAQVPDALMFKEDVQILNGDGSSSNLDGILTDARTFVEEMTPATYAATAFSSVASYDSGTRALITFAAAHGLLSGDNLTIAAATEATYNATHEEILLIDETKVVINLTYVAEADTSAWTGTGTAYAYHSRDTAQEFDVLSVAIARLMAGLYNANACFLNPQSVEKLSTLKGTDAHYVGVSRDAAGNLNINGVPIISIPVIPAGWFLVGDFSKKNIEIRDYTTMGIQFLEDITTKKTNAVVILADEEFHLVKYNPKWYIYDRFSVSKPLLETS